MRFRIPVVPTIAAISATYLASIATGAAVAAVATLTVLAPVHADAITTTAAKTPAHHSAAWHIRHDYPRCDNAGRDDMKGERAGSTCWDFGGEHHGTIVYTDEGGQGVGASPFATWCKGESDMVTNCVWWADSEGNGQGTSYLIDSDGDLFSAAGNIFHS